ncbi:DUF1559 domain-containing protein [Pirellulaceae bacterium SH449]
MYPFPDTVSEFSWWTVVVHLSLLVIATLPFALLLRRSKRKAKQSQLWVLMISLFPISMAIVVRGQTAPSYETPFLVGAFFYFSILIAVTFGIVTVRLKKQSGSTPVVAIVGTGVLLLFIIGLLLPTVPTAREAARRMHCSSNLKYILLGMHNYDSSSKRFPTPAGIGSNGDPVSWRVSLLPFLEQSRLYEKYDQGQSWDSPQNEALQYYGVAPPIYTCPSDPDSIRQFKNPQKAVVYSAYAMATGGGTVTSEFHRPSSSLSQSYYGKIVLVEACGQRIIWSEPRDAEVTEDSIGVNLDGQRPGHSRGVISSYHTGGANFGRLDGSVGFMSKDIDREVLRQLLDAESEVLDVY